MSAIAHLALSQELQRLRTEYLMLREALEFYAQGRTPYYEQFDLGLTARQALARCDVAAENVAASESVLDGVSQ